MPMAGLANGTTITFGTSSFTANIRRIGGANETREAVETAHLGTTGQKTKIPASLTDPGTTEIEFEWDQSFGVFPPIDAVAETITITYPLKSGETANATEAGTGFLTEAEGPTCEDGQLMVGRARIQWDGLTDRVYTAGS
jgi:hypothetical protein